MYYVDSLIYTENTLLGYMQSGACHNPQVLFHSAVSQPVSSQPALMQRVTPPHVHNFALRAAFVGPDLKFLLALAV